MREEERKRGIENRGKRIEGKWDREIEGKGWPLYLNPMGVQRTGSVMTEFCPGSHKRR